MKLYEGEVVDQVSSDANARRIFVCLRSGKIFAFMVSFNANISVLEGMIRRNLGHTIGIYYTFLKRRNLI